MKGWENIMPAAIDKELYNAVKRNESVTEIQKLINLGANVNFPYKDMQDKTVFEYCKNPEVYKVLVNNLTDINEQDDKGETLLHRLMGTVPQEEILQVVLDAGIDLSIKNNDGKTAWDDIQRYFRHYEVYEDYIKPKNDDGKENRTTTENMNKHSDSLNCSMDSGKLTSDTNSTIKCSTCGATLPEGATFCPACGTKTQTLCPCCGAEIILGTKFCISCGQNL